MIDRFLGIALACTCAVMAVSCGNDEEKKIAQIEAKAAHTKTVLANQCKLDSDCMMTGCRHTMCRAMPEPDYCDHRIVIALEDASDMEAVKQIAAKQLTPNESDTIRMGGYAAGRWTLSFHASQAQRERIETMLGMMSQSGFARLHPNAGAQTQAAFEALSAKKVSDIALMSMRGAGVLIEKKIRSGDILSKDDIRDAWAQLDEIRNLSLTPDDAIERIWAYDIIFDAIASLRIWPIDRRQRISIGLWRDFSYRVDNGDIVISARLSDSVADTFRAWTSAGELIVLMLGNEIIATAIPEQPIEDGRFELIIQDGVKNEALLENVGMLENVVKMKGMVRIDSEATASVERDISCQKRFPRECGCIDGYCGWKTNPEYNACLYE